VIEINRNKKGAAIAGDASLLEIAAGLFGGGLRLNDLGVSVPNQPANDLDARGHIGMRPAQVVQLLQGVDVHADVNDVFHVNAPGSVRLNMASTYASDVAKAVPRETWAR
jgi:hypothetical protein